MEDYPRNLKEFDVRFRSEEACREYLLQLRWPDGFRCPCCGCRESSPVRAVLLRCRDCRHQTSVTAGTIFQDTRTSLRLWFSSHMVGGQSEELCQRVGAATSAGSEEL